MLKMDKIMAVFLMTMLLSACAAYSQKKETNHDVSNKNADKNLTLCGEPRPQICTQEYKPVCAVLKNGTTKTAATGCTACADTNVISYKKGAC